MCDLCVLSCVVSGGGPDVLLPIFQGGPPLVYLSIVRSKVSALLQASDPRSFGF